MDDAIKYWFYINPKNPGRGFVFGIRTGDRWANRVYEYEDENGKELPSIVSYRGTDEAIVFDFMNSFPDWEDEYFESLNFYEECMLDLKQIVGD